MYDLLGREFTKMNIGQIYIRNNKKYIKINWVNNYKSKYLPNVRSWKGTVK